MSYHSRILVMGLPGTGKTTFAEELRKQLVDKGYTVTWFNADQVRSLYNDWDFSMEGRKRQSERMRSLGTKSMTDFTICDFVAPTKEIRNIFSADYVIWMDTEEKSIYEDTNSVFENPDFGEYHYRVKVKDASNTVPTCVSDILPL